MIYNSFLDEHCKNECTEVQNPRYKDVTLNAYTSALTKLSLLL